jgi:phytoene dehydrogenase-like protein
VISNADPKRTFLRLLDPTVLEPGFVTRITNYRARGTTARITLVLSAAPRFSGITSQDALVGRIHIGPGIDYLEQAFDASKYGRWSERPWLDVRVPTIGDPELARNGKQCVSVIAHFAPYTLRDGDWRAAGESFCDTVVRILEEYAPGLSASLVARDVLTPRDLEDRYGLTGGHIHHGEPALDQLFVMRPVMGWARYRTPVPGLYLCGAGTHPGLGLTGGSGQNAAREILRDLR